MFVENTDKHACHIVELKDGCEFDTKSSSAELRSITGFIQNNAQKLQYTFDGHICCFNETSKDMIVKGFKGKIPIQYAMTGREFCNLLKIDYDEIVQGRLGNTNANLDFFLDELVKDDDIRERLRSRLER